MVHDAKMGKDAAFIEMEYIRGQSLNKLMRPGEPMPLDWVARILDQLCDVLQEAHDCKIVHRDLKPSNLMLIEGRAPGREHLKVLDFGIAKILESETEGGTDFKTSTGAFMGSALWTSPEQASGGKIDGRSDLYSVGIILYEMLTGSRPFSGQLAKVIYNQLYTPPPPFAEKNPDAKYPPELEAVVLRCLAKNPDDRYQSARELGEAFHRALPAGIAAGHPMNFSVSNRAPRSSPIEPPPTEIASDPALRGTEPDKPAFRGSSAQTKGLEKTVRAEVDTSPYAKDRHALAPVPTRTRPSRWKALIPLLLLIGLALVAAGLIKELRPTPPPPWTPPQGYEAEVEPGAPPSALPVALVRIADTIKKKNGDKYNPRFIHIIGDKYRMGNGFDQNNASNDDEDQPAHLVVLSDFYMQESEVTNGEMAAYFIANEIPEKDRPKRWMEVCETLTNKGQDPTLHPAVGISHHLAELYARWIGGKLPTEAQWEFTARSRGKNLRYATVNEQVPSKYIVNVDTLGELGVHTMEIRHYEKDRTEQLVYDLTGNVREWCRDIFALYQVTENPVVDPVGPEAPKGAKPSYVIRGGSFATSPDIRTTRPRRPDPQDKQDRANEQMDDDGTSDDVGFRVVIEWPPRKP
jgi:serine/threonine-protein kinase